MTDVNASARSTDKIELKPLQPGDSAKSNSRAMRQSYQAPDRVVPKSPRLLAQRVHSPQASHSTSAQASVSSDVSPTVLSATEPTLKPCATDTATPAKFDSPEKSRVRSDSSPASLASPLATPPQPKFITPALVPTLNLQAVARHPADNAGSPNSSPTVSPIKSPTRQKSPRGSARVQVGDGKAISTSAPSTRRATHPQEQYKPSSIRSRIDSSPRKSIQSPKKNVISASLEPLPSPRKVDRELMTLCDEVARLWISELTKKRASARDSDIKSLSRTDVLISLVDVSPALLSRLKKRRGQTIKHSELIKTLYMPLFERSDAGKTLIAMKKSVMGDYDGDKLGQVELADKSLDNPAFKRLLLMNMDERADAVIAVAFGRKDKNFADSKFPQELLHLWKSVDRELCAWTSDRQARANLAFDLLMTRMTLALVVGDPNEVDLGIPNVFFEAIKKANDKVWDDFVGCLIGTVDAERQASTTASPGGGSVSTTGQAPPANT